MTTSILNTHTRGCLTDFDLQVLRDYALEAPWEWRMVLEQLIEDAKTAERVEESEDTVIELRDALKDHSDELEKRVVAFEVAVAEASRSLGLAWVPGNKVM